MASCGESVANLVEDSPLVAATNVQHQNSGPKSVVRRAEVIDLSSNDSEEEVHGQGREGAQACAGPGSAQTGHERALWGDLGSASAAGSCAHEGARSHMPGSVMYGPPQEGRPAPPPLPSGPARRRIRVKPPLFASGCLQRVDAGHEAPSLPCSAGLPQLDLLAPPGPAPPHAPPHPMQPTCQPGAAGHAMPHSASTLPRPPQAALPPPSGSSGPWPDERARAAADSGATRPPRRQALSAKMVADRPLHAARLPDQLPLPLQQQQQQRLLQGPLELPSSPCVHPVPLQLDPCSLAQPQQHAPDCSPARQRRRLNPRSLPSNPPVQPRGQPAQPQRRKPPARGRGGGSGKAEVYTLDGSSSSDDEVEVTACVEPPVQPLRQQSTASGRRRAAAAAPASSSHTSSLSGQDEDERLALELQREEDSRLAQELAQKLEEDAREELMRARWDVMEAIEEESSRHSFGAPFRFPGLGLSPARPQGSRASGASRNRDHSSHRHAFRASPRSGPHAVPYSVSWSAARGGGWGDLFGGVTPPLGLFGSMTGASGSDDERCGYEYERGAYRRGPVFGRWQGGPSTRPLGGALGAQMGWGLGLRNMLAAGGRGSNLPPSMLFSDRDFTADDYDALCRLDESVENRTGATRAEINALPTEVVRSTRPQGVGADGHGGVPETLECAICLEDVQPGDVLRTTPCLHKFHKKCLDTWLAHKARCPVCQASCKL